MTMSNLQKRMHRRNLPPLLPSLHHSPVSVVSSDRISFVHRIERSIPLDTEPQETLTPDIMTPSISNLTTPSPSEEFWDLFNHKSGRAEARDNTESVAQYEECHEFVMDGDATWDGSQTSDEEFATDLSSEFSDVEADRDHYMHKEEICQEGVPILTAPSVYLKLNNQLNEITQAQADSHSNSAEILSPPSQRLKLNPEISDTPNTVDTQPIGILWRPQDLNTTHCQPPFSDTETPSLPSRFSSPSPPSNPSLAVTKNSMKRTREGETINRSICIPPIQDPESRLLLLPQFNVLRTSKRKTEDQDPDIASVHIASLRERGDCRVEQIAGPEERENATKRREEYGVQCKGNEGQYDGQIMLCRLVVKKERFQDEIKRAE